jgi:precorrin-4/cobalt-precorrin-4 C11-methyltransferase
MVLHLAVRRTRELMAELAPAYGADCPAVVVYRASQPDEVVLTATVSTIADEVERAGLTQAAVIMVGRALHPAAGGESYLYSQARDRSRRP